MKVTLSGKEASVLSLLARSRGQLGDIDMIRLLDALDRPARRIGVAICTGVGSDWAVKAAKGFTDWADALENRRRR